MESILGLRSMFPYPGGKSILAKRLVDVFPSHSTYVEPFVGGGSLFFEKEPVRRNVISDANPGVMKVYKDFSCQTMKQCAIPQSKVCSFSRKAKKDVERGKGTMCQQIAYRRFTIASAGGGIKTDECTTRPIIPLKVSKNCEEYERRLNKATKRVGDYRTVMSKYDSPTTLHYLDPPYWKTFNESYQREGGRRLKKADIPSPSQICNFIRGMKGKVILSYNDHPDVRKACNGKGLQMKSIKVQQRMVNVERKSDPMKRELIISNFKLGKLR